MAAANGSRKAVVLLNPSAGTLAGGDADSGEAHEVIRRAFADHGIEADVRPVDAEHLAAASKEAAGSSAAAVIAGGGDGTLNAVASALVGTSKPFGVLPLGTHNHFAKDLGVPLELPAAAAALAAALAAGNVQPLDVAEVNGRLFLNFSALGLHPNVVKHRDTQQDVHGRSKPFAMAVAIFAGLKRMPLLNLTFTADGKSFRRKTPSVIVCNNEYQMKVFGVDNVSKAGRGSLNVYLAKDIGPTGIVRLMARAATRTLPDAKGFESMAVTELRIDTPRPHQRSLRVSIDGEVTDLPTPLHYRVRPAGLTVLVPAAAGG